jgi:4,5-DOPA dioxygenase extradiol
MGKRMPVLFVGHGSPMNAIEDNQWGRGFTALAKMVPRPAAILSISAHWFLPGTMVTAEEAPKTIHDFGGFPRELYEVGYPSPGSPELAVKVAGLLAGHHASTSMEWGLDHGTWSVLRRMFPKADIPVIQLSIDRRRKPAEHLEMGRALAPLRDEGVLIMGSGNIVHNLMFAMEALYRGDKSTPEWAASVDSSVEEALLKHDSGALVKLPETRDGKLAHPVLDHYLPLLYAVGASGEKGPVKFPITGFDLGSLSMRAVLWG